LVLGQEAFQAVPLQQTQKEDNQKYKQKKEKRIHVFITRDENQTYIGCFLNPS